MKYAGGLPSSGNRNHGVKVGGLSGNESLTGYSSEEMRIMPTFRQLSQSEIAIFLKQTGKMITSLSLVGTFLSHVGFTMLLDMH